MSDTFEVRIWGCGDACLCTQPRVCKLPGDKPWSGRWVWEGTWRCEPDADEYIELEREIAVASLMLTNWNW